MSILRARMGRGFGAVLLAVLALWVLGTAVQAQDDKVREYGVLVVSVVVTDQRIENECFSDLVFELGLIDSELHRDGLDFVGACRGRGFAAANRDGIAQHELVALTVDQKA